MRLLSMGGMVLCWYLMSRQKNQSEASGLRRTGSPSMKDFRPISSDFDPRDTLFSEQGLSSPGSCVQWSYSLVTNFDQFCSEAFLKHTISLKVHKVHNGSSLDSQRTVLLRAQTTHN